MLGCAGYGFVLHRRRLRGDHAKAVQVDVKKQPPPLPKGWEEMQKKKQQPPFSPKDWGDTRGQAGATPPLLPEGWEVKRDDDGAEYYWNGRQRKASWSVPQLAAPKGEKSGGMMPSGWKAYVNDEGYHYYVNERNRSASWTHPADKEHGLVSGAVRASGTRQHGQHEMKMAAASLQSVSCNGFL